MQGHQKAAALMVLSMGLFAFEDVFIKLLTASLPTGIIMACLGIAGGLLFWAVMAARGIPLWSRDLLHPMVVLRNLGEAGCAVCFASALAIGDLSTASAIIQALPLTMTLGAALLLGEQVGWRRWASILVGFIGVLLIVRPGSDAFQLASLLALGAVVMLTLRDLATRRVPAHVSSDALTASAFLATGLAGISLAIFQHSAVRLPAGGEMAYIFAALCFGLGGYLSMVIATRIAPVAAIAPFRYARIVFALILGVLIFGERPDALTLLGAAIIVGSGIYTMWREARRKRRDSWTPAEYAGNVSVMVDPPRRDLPEERQDTGDAAR